MNEGFFMLKRSFFSHWLWDQDRVYNQGEAFLDLLQLAAFAPFKRVISGKLITIPVGGIAASERFLSERWKWSRTKVRHFLSLLEQDGMVKQEKDQGQTVLILCNYAKHSSYINQEKTTEEPPEDHPKTGEEPNKKKRKKGKKRESASAPPPAPDFSDPDLQAAWELWLQSRKEKRNPVKPTARKLQLNKLNKLSKVDALAMLQHSTENGYTGLFGPNDSGSGGKGGRNSDNANGRADSSDFDLQDE